MMKTTEPLTPENCREELLSKPGILQHGFVKSFSNLFISQPLNVTPSTADTDAMFYLKLNIEPDSSSDIAVLYIRFEPEQSAYAAVRYGSTNGNASKPVSHYAGIMDMLKAAQTSARKVEVFLQVNADGRNALVLL